MVSMETKVVSRDSFLDKHSENFTWMDSEKGNWVFAGGGGAQCAPPPLSFGAQKPGWDRVRVLNNAPLAIR